MIADNMLYRHSTIVGGFQYQNQALCQGYQHPNQGSCVVIGYLAATQI